MNHNLIIGILSFVSIGIFLGCSIKYFLKKDFLNPILIVSLSYLVSLGLYSLVLFCDINYLTDLVKISEDELDTLYLKYWFLKISSYFFLLLGIYFSKKVVFKFFYLDYQKLTKKRFLSGLLIFLLTYSLLIKKNGGLFYIVTNLNKRVQFLSGNMIYQLLMLFGIYSLALYTIELKKDKSKKLYYVTAILVLLLTSLLGGRTEVLIGFVVIFISYYYNTNKLKLITFKTMMCGLIISFFIVFSPILRDSKKVEKIKAGNYSILILETDFSLVGKIINELSRQWIQIYILKEYADERLELGNTFLDIPRYILSNREDRVPLDEGVYIWNRYLGNVKRYGTPLKEMSRSSWPPTTLGNAYINFGVIGVFISMFILGIIYEKIYRIILYKKYDPLYILIYFYLLKYFSITNIGIVSTILKFISLFIFIILFGRPLKIRSIKI